MKSQSLIEADRKRREEHAAEAERLSRELDGLGSEFAEDGVVRWVLRERIEQENRRAQ
jgi:hypothetical protein